MTTPTANRQGPDVRRIAMAERDAFKHGYLIAVANVMNLHGEDVIAEDLLVELGETESCIRRLDLCDFDAKPLRKLFREIKRKQGDSR